MKTFTNLAHRAFKKCASLGTNNRNRYYLFSIIMLLTLGVGNAWGETKTEGFEEATTSTNYQGTVTVNTEQSDCGIGWTIYYGCVSTSSKISGNNSAALRLYTSNNYGYLKTTTPIDGLSNVTFKAKAATSNSAKIKVNISYSKDGSTWTNIKSDETYGTTSQSKSYDIPSGGKYFQIAISSNSTKPSKSNAQLTIDDIVFTYTSPATPDPVDPTVTFSNGNYTVGQTLDLSTLWTSNSDGAVTYTIDNAGTTGASINDKSFTATAAGTCTVKASQAATSTYNAIEKTATITVSAPTPATVSLSEAGAVTNVADKNVGDSYTLPSTSTQTCGDKVFVGWSTVEIATPGYKPTSNFYEPGTTVTLAAEQTFYAVYATKEAGGGNVFDGSAGGTFKIYAVVNETNYYAKGTGSKISSTTNEGEATEYTFTKISDGVFSIKTSSTYITYASSSNLGTNNTTAYNWKISAGTNGTWRIASEATNTRGIIYRASTYKQFGGYALSNATAGSTEYFDVEIGGGSAASYTDYTTSCEQETPATDLTDEQLKWSATSATALKGAAENAFPELTNSLEVDVTYTSSNASVATIAADGSITLVAPGTTTISAKFAGGEVSGTKYAAKTVTYTLTVKQLVSCADIYNLADDATFVLKDFVVTYVNGDYTYLKDATGYGVIYKNSYGLQAGDQVASGKLEGKKDTYKGLVEIIPTTTAADLNATSGIAPEPEVMTNTPTNADINKYVKFENVSFKYTNLNDTYKTNSGKLEGQTEYNIAFYNKFTSNVTFDTSKKYDVVGVVSIKDDAIEVYFISAEEVAEPTLNVKITDTDFGKVAINDSHERTLTLNGSLLTKPVELTIEGDYFTLASNSITPTDGSISEAKIKITYKPTVEGTHTATLKITSDELAEQTITLTGQAVQQHTVHFFVNGEEDETLAKKVLSGEKLTEIPTATSCDPLEYPTFIGWSASEITGTTDVEPTDLLDLNTTITADCDYYAVFAKSTTTSGGAESATMAYSGATTNMTDGNNASTVGLDEALFTITSDKGGQGNHVGLNKDGDIRLYASKTDGNGNILTIAMAEGYTITQISLAIKQTATFVVKANGQSISGTDNVYDINHSSCSIQNTTTGATTQLQFNSITISYTTSTISKEYLTTCESATPTYTVTYNLDGGESTCETSVVVEQDGELTLCDAPTKTGHKFLKWKDQNDNEYAAGAKITVSEDLTLTAQWQVNSYEVTWMSLGDEVLVNQADYNTQPTKPTTAPSYTCGIGTKEFVGWSTQEIDGAGVPANLYTDEFPVVTEAITYHAVFASKIEGGGSMSKAVSLTNGETVYLATESGIGVTGAVAEGKDATASTTQSDWMPFTIVTNGLQYQFKTGDNYITAAAKSFKITETPSNFAFENGYIVYNVSSGSDAGDYVLLVNNNDPTKPYYRFYKESNMSNSKYETFYVYKNPTHTDYTTSCPVLDLTEGENTLTDGVTADVKVNRSFDKDKLYTLSLPFALDAEQVETIFGAGTTLYQFAKLAKEGEDLVLYFSTPSAIAAATPYLIQPTQNVAAGFTVEDATISTTPNNISFTVDATTITMMPILSADRATTNGSTEYWLAANKILYNNANTLLSLRALFNISTVSGMPPRCRVALGENAETGVDNIINGENTTIKVIENGQLIIIRNGEKFNAQGVRL